MSGGNKEGWLIPNEWARRLHRNLDEIGEQFFQTPWQIADDPAEHSGLILKQELAMKAIMEVCLALRELPPFECSKGVATLHTIATAMDDVVHGGLPQLFKAAIKGSPGGDGLKLRYVQGLVVFAVRYLAEAHKLSVNTASKKVAPIFAAAGATGRTGKRLSHTTVKGWAEKINQYSSNAEDLRTHRQIEEYLAKVRQQPEWPGTLEDALFSISKLANDPLPRSKYG